VAIPYLEYHPEGEEPRRIPIDPLPFRIGRGSEATFVVHSRSISKVHAELARHGQKLTIEDLRSRNGTFVNGVRIAERVPLTDGDVVHLAHAEFRFRTVLSDDDTDATEAKPLEDTHRVVQAFHDLYRIISQRGVRAVFQPIVRLTDRGVIGFEALGRSAIEDVSRGPAELLRLAAARGQAVELSTLMRDVAARDVAALPRPTRIFINVHPDEMASSDFIERLPELPALVGQGRTLVLEVHEVAVTEKRAMARMARVVRELGMELAYDDFGAGQSRLLELAEAPPDYIKLDMALVRDIHRHRPRQELVRALTGVMRDMGIGVIAEGIENEDEYLACAELGCGYGQGFFIREPTPAHGL
jgi:EAL domain-containing protein (putative c-di-GMP-specific phosphodiesterase class I)